MRRALHQESLEGSLELHVLGYGRIPLSTLQTIPSCIPSHGVTEGPAMTGSMAVPIMLLRLPICVLDHLCVRFASIGGSVLPTLGLAVGLFAFAFLVGSWFF